MSGTNDEPFTAGAAEAARLVQEVQELGFQAARTVVERFVELFAQFAAANGAAGRRRQGAARIGRAFWESDPVDAGVAVGHAASGRFVHGAHGATERGGAPLPGRHPQWAPPPPSQGDLRLPDVAPGGRVSATAVAAQHDGLGRQPTSGRGVPGWPTTPGRPAGGPGVVRARTDRSPRAGRQP